MIRSEFMAAVNAVASDRGIDPAEVLDTLKQALLAAYRKDYGEDESIEVKIDPESGEISLMKDDEDVTPSGFGRIAAQTAKQVILQRVREAEKDAILADYRDKIDTVVSGMLQRREGRNWFVDIGKTIALMPIEEQVYAEEYHQNLRLKFLIKDIREFRGREMVIVSRNDSGLVEGLFDMEVPEIASGIVEIKAIAREEGLRSKVAVATNQEGVDPIGSTVGQRGVRVQAIIDELMGEKIDIVLWNPDTERFIVSALSPAKVLRIELNKTDDTAKVLVPDDQLSLAIGKEGQNVRLAAKLTGYKIDLIGEGGMESAADKNKVQGLEFSTRVENALLAAGINTIDKLRVQEDFSKIEGVGPKAVEEIEQTLANLPQEEDTKEEEEIEESEEIETEENDADGINENEEGEEESAENSSDDDKKSE